MPVTVWMLKGFFDNIPFEIEEAASIDGCSSLRILFQIVLPILPACTAAVGCMRSSSPGTSFSSR